MPLMRYFGFVGSALLLLLFGLDWYLPQPAVESVRAVTDRPAIRISSIEKLPERVVIDTSNPIAAAPPVHDVLRFFTNLDVGYGSAIATVMTLIILVVSVVFLWLQRRHAG